MFTNKHLKENTILASTLFILFLCTTVCSASPDIKSDIKWNTIESRYTKINYQSLEDLAKFNKKVEYGDNGSLSLLFFGLETDKLINTVSKKVDTLYERVQDILDMHRKMKKITINIYHDKDELNKAYSRIYNEPCNIRAWYILDKNTVYVNVSDLHEGMLAHEIAHSIIDHFLLISPPPASAEILARYVDAHLHNPAVIGSSKSSSHALSSYSED